MPTNRKLVQAIQVNTDTNEVIFAYAEGGIVILEYPMNIENAWIVHDSIEKAAAILNRNAPNMMNKPRVIPKLWKPGDPM